MLCSRCFVMNSLLYCHRSNGRLYIAIYYFHRFLHSYYWNFKWLSKITKLLFHPNTKTQTGGDWNILQSLEMKAKWHDSMLLASIFSAEFSLLAADWMTTWMLRQKCSLAPVFRINDGCSSTDQWYGSVISKSCSEEADKFKVNNIYSIYTLRITTNMSPDLLTFNFNPCIFFLN